MEIHTYRNEVGKPCICVGSEAETCTQMEEVVEGTHTCRKIVEVTHLYMV